MFVRAAPGCAGTGRLDAGALESPLQFVRELQEGQSGTAVRPHPGVAAVLEQQVVEFDAPHAKSAAAHRHDSRGRRVGELDAELGDRHATARGRAAGEDGVGSVAGQLLRGGAPNAAIAARHDGDLGGQVRNGVRRPVFMKPPTIGEHSWRATRVLRTLRTPTFAVVDTPAWDHGSSKAKRCTMRTPSTRTSA